MSGGGFFDRARAKAAASGARGGSERLRLARLNAADRPADAGFASIAAAQLVIRRLKLRAALNDARKSIEALLDSLDQQTQADRDAVSALFDQAGNLIPDAAECVQGNRSVNPIGGDDVREKELLEGVNLILQLLDTLGVGLRHGLFSSSERARSNRPESAAHRLSGGVE